MYVRALTEAAMQCGVCLSPAQPAPAIAGFWLQLGKLRCGMARRASLVSQIPFCALVLLVSALHADRQSLSPRALCFMLRVCSARAEKHSRKRSLSSQPHHYVVASGCSADHGPDDPDSPEGADLFLPLPVLSGRRINRACGLICPCVLVMQGACNNDADHCLYLGCFVSADY